MAATSKPHVCPFPHCAKSFARKYDLRSHLSNLKLLADSGEADKHHPKDKAFWATVTESDLFKNYHSRPGNLTEEEQKKRRSRNSQASYSKNKDERVARSKANRDELRKIANVAAELGDVVGPLVPALENASDVFRELQTLPEWERYMCKDHESNTEPSITTFFRIVAFFIPTDDWPVQPEPDSDERPTLAELIPGRSQYRAISRLCHPDKQNGIDPRVQQAVDSSWKMLETVLESNGGDPTNGQASAWLLPGQSEEEIKEFKALSPMHSRLYGIYKFWLDIAQGTRDNLRVKKSSIWQVKSAVVTAEMVSGVQDRVVQAQQGKRRLSERDERRPKRKRTENEE
jgi:hypothetical protein